MVISDKTADQILAELSIDLIRDWLKQDVTQVFFSFLDTLRRDNETNIFTALAGDNSQDAANDNAAREEDLGIMLIPDQIISAIELRREEKGKAKNET